MKILVLGGTRFFGIHMVNDLIEKGHDVTIATRGNTPDDFGDSVSRIRFERTDEDSIKAAIAGTHYDVIIDKIAYCSNDI
ncbi:MAG: NAD-dependent epimerase/dehydratase family protein, partial [Clostridiales bacterium]|nr:NAD-dependent epimerase/dehydratase family protein [Clostridiales bacterium]